MWYCVRKGNENLHYDSYVVVAISIASLQLNYWQVVERLQYPLYFG